MPNFTQHVAQAKHNRSLVAELVTCFNAWAVPKNLETV